MNKFYHIVNLLLFLICFRVFAATSTINGIEWTYTIVNGEAVLGGLDSYTPAVPYGTTGHIEIPRYLGGYPVTSIGPYAFDGSRIHSIDIHDGITSIGEWAFFNSALRGIKIPASVTQIDKFAFDMCGSMKKIIFLCDDPSYIGGTVYNRWRMFDDMRSDFVIKVKRGTRGWDGYYWSTSLPSSYEGYPIQYATDYEVSTEYSYTYTDVEFNPAGGFVNPNITRYLAYSSFGILPIPTRYGYIFDGWYYKVYNGDDVDDVIVTAQSQVPMAMGDFVLTARWIEESSVLYHPVYRFYSKSYRGHFFTLDANERATLMCTNPNWKYEGIAYYAAKEQITGTVPLYRFYSKAYRGHFFTIDEEEMETVRDTNPNWKYEGIAYYVYPEEIPGMVPVYRFWSKAYRHHFYTIDEAEKDTLIRTNPNWKYEGIAFWAMAGLPTSTSTASLQSLTVPSMALADASISDVDDIATDEDEATEKSANELDATDDWTLTVESDGVTVTSLGEMICNGFTLVTSEETPPEDELVLEGEEVEGLAFSLKIPEGEYDAYLWNAASNELTENEATGGVFDFDLPRLGSWYWFTIQDEAGEQPFGIWMKAE